MIEKNYLACMTLFMLLALGGCSTTSSRLNSGGADVDVEAAVEPMVLPPLSSPESSSRDKGEVPAVITLLAKAEQSQNDGDINLAMAHVERALRIDPHSSAAYYQIASLKMQQGKAHEALQLAQKALNFEPASSSLQVDLWELVAVCKDFLGDSHGAKRASERAQMLR